MKTLKYIILLVGVFFIEPATCLAQVPVSQIQHLIIDSNKDEDIFVTDDLSDIFVYENNSRTIGFPWNGCHEFTVTIDLELGQVTTVIMLCCTRGVCIPHTQLAEQVNVNNLSTAEIVQSTLSRSGNYTIAVEKGRYGIDKAGQLKDLKYRVTRKK